MLLSIASLVLLSSLTGAALTGVHARAIAVAPAAGIGSSGPAHAAESALTAAHTSLATGHGPASATVRGPLNGSGTGGLNGTKGSPWKPLFQASTQPSARATPAMTYDPSGPYVLYFGGGWNVGSSGNDTWTYAKGVWTNISANLTPAPGPREDAQLAYDAMDGYALLFGGYTGNGVNSSHTLNDTWKFQGGAWTNITSLSTASPSARFASAMTYDYQDGYAVLFGGNRLGGGPLNDTWKFHAGVWTNISAAAGKSPSARDFAAMTDDPADGYVLLFGGWNSSKAALLGDTWSFSAGAWKSVTAHGAPSGTRGASLAYDAATLKVVLFGGSTWSYTGPFQPLAATWTYAGGNWTNLSLTISSAPPARYLAGFTNTSSSGSLLLADGCLAQGCASYVDLSDSWIYNASGPTGRPWSEVGYGPQPSERAGQVMTYDVADGYVLYFGGGWNGGTSTNDTWTFQHNNWTNITASLATSPGPREGPVMAFDAADGYVVLFGGYTAVGGYGSASYTLNDTWKFLAGVWTNITKGSPTAPSPRFVPAMAYDYTDGYLVLFGGNVLQGAPLADTWEFHAGKWKDVTSTAGTAPSGRDFTTMADDPAAGYVVLFGGWSSSTTTIYNDTWSFAAGKWSQLTPSVAPGPLRGVMMAYDPAGKYIVLYGGTTYSMPGWPFGLLAQTWAFHAGNWTNLTPFITTEPPARFTGAMANTSVNGTLVMADGCLYQGCPVTQDLSDTWLYNWTSVNGTFGYDLRPALNSTGKFIVHAVGGDGVYHFAYLGLPPGCTTQDAPTLLCTPTQGGSYVVTSLVTDTAGRSLRLSLNLTTGPLPLGLTVSASAPAIDLGQSVTVTAVASGGAGAPWTFSYTGLPLGCTSANAASVTCTPTASGAFQIVATVTDAKGAHASSTTPLTVHAAVQLAGAVSASAVDLGQTVTVTATPNGGAGAPWTFRYTGLPLGCVSMNAASLLCTPSASGAFQIVATATDTLGGHASASVPLTVNAAVYVAGVVSAPAIDLGESVAFSAAAAYGSTVYSYVWSNLPAGCSAGSTATVLCQPSVTGGWAVTVTATDSLGQSATTPISLTVNPLPTVQLAVPVASTTDPLSALFSVTPVGGTGPFVVAWNFGDGQTASGLTVSHHFATSGTYSVSVWVVDSRGFTATSSQPVTVPRASTITHPGGIGASPWYETIAGMFVIGVTIGLLGVALVAVWAIRRTRGLREGERLVETVASSTAAPPTPKRVETPDDGPR